MADSKVSALDSLGSIDRTADYLYVVDATGPTSNKMTVNSVLGLSGGNPVSTSDTQTLTNKTITTPTITVLDNALTVQDNSDNTKQLQLQLSGITTATTRTLTIPDASTTIVGTDATQTLTNKTLTSPTINGGTIDNPTMTIDTISEDTAANGVTIDGLNIKDSKLNTDDSVVADNITAGAVTPEKLVSGAGTGWSWQSWSPTWTNLTVGNGTVSAFYAQTGKTVLFRIGFVFGSTSSISGSVSFTLPVTATSYSGTTGLQVFGVGRILDTGTASFEGRVVYNSTTSAAIAAYNAGSTYLGSSNFSSTVPMTWATGDEFYMQGFYEAA